MSQPQGADLQPTPLLYAREAGRNHLNEEITPLLPTGNLVTFYRCQHVVQESGQADQAYQQEQLTAWDPSHLLYTVLLSQGIEFTTAFSVINSI
jgi:hypothetical protein